MIKTEPFATVGSEYLPLLCDSLHSEFWRLSSFNNGIELVQLNS